MTAEVAILNKSAVALAADSAMTLSRSGQEKDKIFNTVNKLFMASKYHPVGIMIYGGADFMEIPWESIIKNYRAKLSTKSKPKIESYTKDFINFITREVPVSSDLQKRNTYNILNSHFTNLVNEIIEKIVHSKGSKASFREQDVLLAIEEIVKVRTDFLKRVPFSKGFRSAVFPRTFERSFLKAVDDVFDVSLKKKQVDLLRIFSGYLLSKEVLSDQHSGIVIAGFGDKEIFPSLLTIHTEGIINGKLKFTLNEEGNADIGRKHDGKETPAAIIAFAQKDMVRTFMEGINSELEDFIFDGFSSILADFASDVVKQNIKGSNASLKKRINSTKRILEKAVHNFFNKTEDVKLKYFIDPVVNMIAHLPKEDLGSMAEALVNLTSLKRRVSSESETVGGPVDVAVISKGDGFIWIKRKHYFEKDLNHHYFSNYFK